MGNLTKTPNFYKHSGHFYSVLNQNGLKGALYSFFDAKSPFQKQEVKRMLQNFPTRYPTSFIIVDQSFECGRVYLEEVDLGDLAHSYPDVINGSNPNTNQTEL